MRLFKSVRNVMASLSMTAFMLLMVTGAYAQAYCERITGFYFRGTSVEYWCCSGPDGCFWDVY